MNKPICKISNARGVAEGLWERGDVETLIDVLTTIEYIGLLYQLSMSVSGNIIICLFVLRGLGWEAFLLFLTTCMFTAA